MKKQKILVLLMMIIIFFSGCEKYSENELLNEKINSEIEFLESNIINISKNYITGEYRFDSNLLDWNKIYEDFKLVEDASNIIIIDLASNRTKNKNIMDFENCINQINFSIDSQDEMYFLENIYNMYLIIPEVLLDMGEDKTVIQIKQLKCKILYGEILSMFNNFESAYEIVNDANLIYGELMENQKYLEENVYKINRDYINLQEFKNFIQAGNINEITRKYLECIESF